MVVILITIQSSENSSPLCQFLDGCYCRNVVNDPLWEVVNEHLWEVAKDFVWEDSLDVPDKVEKSE